jgi:glycosyltransferase involved in cell wall biosynthesis
MALRSSEMKKKKLKILFYCNDSIENINSMEYYNQDIESLKALGHEVRIINSYLDIKLNFDIIYIWWWTYALFPVILAKILRKKSIICGVFNFTKVKTIDKSGFLSRPFYQRLLIILAAKLTDKNIFVSKLEFDEVPKYFNLNNCFYSPCVIADKYFNNSNTSINREGILNISWSGKENLKRKGIYDLLNAIKIIKDIGINIKCNLAGRRGDGYIDLLQFIKELNLEDNVTTLGEVSLEKKITLYQNTLLYIQPSHFEGFGLATAEALASGCCIIACDVGEVKNVLGDNAIYINPGDHRSLADAILMAYSDPEIRSNLITNGRIRLKELFTIQKKNEALKLIIDQFNI